jgi:hypothetical protein
MRIHLITLAGVNLDVFPFMLAHYRAMGIESAVINIHLRDEDDPIRHEARSIAAGAGYEIAANLVGEFHPLQLPTWRESMQRHANDWCVLAEQDELQRYPDDLWSLLAFADRHGYDYITGAFVDRVAGDGGFPAVDLARPIAEQFPLGGFVSYPMIGADPRKVVAAKGRVPVVVGQHRALEGIGCPVEEIFVPVHHYKWTGGLAERMRVRADTLRGRAAYWVEPDRLVQYYQEHGGRIDLRDPRFMIARCDPDYPHWPELTRMAQAERDRAAAAAHQQA